MPEAEPISTTRLIQQAAQGDEAAFALLWARYRRLIYAMARERLTDEIRSDADTDDVAGMVGMKLRPEKLRHITSREHLINLLRQIVSGTINDLKDAAWPMYPLPDDSALAPEAPPDALERPPELLDLLPRRLYEVAVLIADDCSERDAADALGITRHEVRIRLDAIRDLWLAHLSEE